MITLTMTTCQRIDLFRQTIKSFSECCLDKHLIGRIILVDDGSSLKEIDEMSELLKKNLNAKMDIFIKGKDNKGHQQSMNILYDNIDTDYILHLEDDWLFTKEDDFISKSLFIMMNDPSIKQVLLRTADIMAVNQTNKILCIDSYGNEARIEYIKYEYLGNSRDGRNRPAWCGWNLNPAVWNFKEIKKLGKFPLNNPCFEFNYSRKYWQSGYKVAYFPHNYCEHIGGERSAYKINGTKK